MIRFLYKYQKYWQMLLGLIAASFMLFPVYWMFTTGLKTQSEILTYPPTLFPSNPVLDSFVINFKGRGNSPSILIFMRNSLIIGLGNMTMCLLFAVPSAYALARKRIKGKEYIILLLLITQMFPAIMLATPIYIMYVKYGLMDNFIGLIFANMTASMPFTIIMIRPFFLSLPSDLEDAALIDGCNKLSTYFRIILPLVKPALITVGAFTFLQGWGELLYAITLSDSSNMRPVTVKIYNYISEYSSQWNHLMAAAFISAVPIIIVFAFLQKHIISGMTAGAIKS